MAFQCLSMSFQCLSMSCLSNVFQCLRLTFNVFAMSFSMPYSLTHLVTYFYLFSHIMSSTYFHRLCNVFFNASLTYSPIYLLLFVFPHVFSKLSFDSLSAFNDGRDGVGQKHFCLSWCLGVFCNVTKLACISCLLCVPLFGVPSHS